MARRREGRGEQGTDGRAFQSLLGSLFGLAFPFLSRTKATLFRPYVHMDAGRKYSPLFCAGSADTTEKQAADRHTRLPYVTHVCQKQQPTSPTIVSIVRLAYNPFSYIQCSSPTRYPFVAVYSSIGPRVFHRPGYLAEYFSSLILYRLTGPWKGSSVGAGNRAFREFARLFLRVFFALAGRIIRWIRFERRCG